MTTTAPPPAPHSHDDPVRRSHEDTIIELGRKIDTANARQTELVNRMQGMVDTVLSFKKDVDARFESVETLLENEREDRHRNEDVLRDSVRDMAQSIRDYIEEVREYRRSRTKIESERDAALGIRVQSNGSPRTVMASIAKVMSEPWWWATVLAFAGGLTIKFIVDMIEKHAAP